MFFNEEEIHKLYNEKVKLPNLYLKNMKMYHNVQ